MDGSSCGKMTVNLYVFKYENLKYLIFLKPYLMSAGRPWDCCLLVVF